jgi:hypothetical protein
MIRRSPSITAALFLVLLFPLILTAQTAQVGTINGQVKDQTGGALPGVAVEAKHEERGITRTATTDSSGRFRMPALPLGQYTVTATLSGFDTATSRHNVVESEKTTDLSIAMKLGTTSESITVSAEVPVVDRTNVAARTNLRAEEFQKLPVGRNYQALMGLAPGVPTTGGGNVNAHGALSGNNLFLFDGADVTDPTTGTFASNLNFEAIQEMTMYTAGVSAEYGRAVGAVVNVITKSGGNNLSGSAKLVQTNDKWNEQNTTKNQVTGASLARTKFAHVNPTQNYTLGGPIWRDHAWFFGTYEKAKVTGAQRQTLVTNENYQQTTMDKFYDVRGTFQINPQNNIWIKKHASPTPGFIVDYWGGAADLGALTAQDQTGNQLTGQWTGVFGPNLVAEALAAKTGETINVGTYSLSPLTNGAPHINQADGLAYNGATFVGAVDRPRKQATAALSYFRPFGQATHAFKVGYDWQSFKSTNVFGFPNNQYFVDASFNPFTKTYEPLQRRDYDPVVPSTSTGKIQSFYARDKFDVAKRWFIEAGLRYEKQTGHSDVDRATVDASALAPRFSVSYDLRGNGKSVILGTAGRYYQFIVQDFSDSFAQNAQRANYNNFTWDNATKQYVPAGRVQSSGNAFQPNTSVNPTSLDEVTAGFQQQFGNTVGIGVRGIWRKWHDLIDDVRGFNPDNTAFRRVVNYGPAKRDYKGLELTYEKRFSQHWYGAANYTYSKSSGNHFSTTGFTGLGDYLDAQCRTTVDPTVGDNGVISCREVQEGANKTGRSDFDRPHDLKAQGAYTFNLGPVALTAGSSGEWISGLNYTENRGVNVLRPGTTTNAGPTATYFYEQRGAHRLPNYYRVDGSLEGVVRVFRTAEVGLKAEIFNLTDNQAKINLTNTTWCNNTTNPAAACTTARNTFGTATARGQYLAPRNYRITTLIRF